MRPGLRKFILTLIGLVAYTVIMLVVKTIEPMSLGLGIGFLLTPMAASNAMEYKFKGAK